MRQLFTAILLVCMSFYTTAQVRTQLQVVCGETESLLKGLQGKFQERPVWTSVADDRRSMFMLLFNEQEQNWTFVKFNEDIACILAAGDDGSWLRPGR